jgi:hypothetical protein
MAEGEDRGRGTEERSEESGDRETPGSAEPYDPTSAPDEDASSGAESRSEESGDRDTSGSGETYDPSSAPSEEDSSSDDEARGETEDSEEDDTSAAEDDKARGETEDSDEDDSSDGEDESRSETKAADEDEQSSKDREQERRQKDTPDEEETRQPQKSEDRQKQDDDDDDDDEERKGPPPPFRAFVLLCATVAFLIIGLLLFSAVIAPTYIVALVLAALWFVAAYFLLGRFTRNRRHLRFPIRIAFGGTVLAILLWILINTFNGKTVHEKLVTGQKISQAQPTAHVPEKPQKPAPAQNILLSTGTFKSAGAGSASGQASYVRLSNGTVMVTIKGLDVTSAPTLHVFLATKDGKDVSAHKDLGSLKGTSGDMQYTIPPLTDPRQYKTVVIWNKAFGVPFARAETKLQ